MARCIPRTLYVPVCLSCVNRLAIDVCWKAVSATFSIAVVKKETNKQKTAEDSVDYKRICE